MDDKNKPPIKVEVPPVKQPPLVDGDKPGGGVPSTKE